MLMYNIYQRIKIKKRIKNNLYNLKKIENIGNFKDLSKSVKR